MIRTKVRIQLNNLQASMGNRQKKGQIVLDEQVLKDSNNYAPQDTSELINSSIRMSPIGSGLLIWSTPYARINYYGADRNFSKDKNPNATFAWFEAAKANHLEEWKSIVAKTMGGKPR